jgi:gamma-glutamylcyclotransferase (GGCT)/AIG2-like uncharacterized protein YtfP
MIETALFVYGTLRHDQPEHRRFCRGVYAWQPARVRGRLFRVPAGHRLVVVPPTSVLLHATNDATADEQRRATLSPQFLSDAANPSVADGADWIDGELLRFRDAAVAWPSLDAWEDSTPGRAGFYPRCVVPVSVGESILPVWAYVATEPAPGAVPL